MKPRKVLTKIVTVVLFSLLILSFAVWGIGDIFRGGGGSQVVLQVGDTVIDQQQFARELSNEISTMSRRLGTQLTMDQARAFGIPQQVLSRLASRAVLDEMAARLGMLVTEDQMRGQIFENPNFQDAAGRFDPNRFAQALSFAGYTEQGYLARVGEDIKRQQLTSAVTVAAEAPRSLVNQLFSYREERRRADYVVIAHDSFTDLGEPDAVALQQTYDDNARSFMTPAYKGITLAVLSLADAAAKIAISNERVAEAFEARKDQLGRPERRIVSQTVLPDEAAAQALVDRLGEGADFATAVKEATGRDPVVLGQITQDQLPPELGAAVFALEDGRVTSPVQSPLGWHVALVSGIEPGEEPTLEAHRDQLRQSLAEAEAVDIVIGIANQFDDILAGGASLEDAAARLNVAVRSIPRIDSEARTPSGDLVEGLPAIDDFLTVLQATPLGETSILTETLDGDYFILRVDEEIAAQQKPLSEVSDQAKELWRAAEQARLAQEKATALVERLNGGAALADLAAAEGLDLQQTEAVTRFETDPQRTPSPLISQQLFEIQPGDVTSASTGVSEIVAKLAEILPPDSENSEARLERLQTQLNGALKNDIFEQFLAGLQQEFDVTVNQTLIDQVLAEF